mgnify:CR=1 FL=1
MNNARRREIEKLRARIEDLKEELTNIAEEVQAVLDDEEDALNNTPDSLQGTERYEISEAAAEGGEFDGRKRRLRRRDKFA